MNKPNNVTDNDWSLLKEKYQDLEPIIEKINNDYPIQYLIGNVNFYGYTINVNENVLIPRFETETLIEKTINYINKLNMKSANVLEVGTGSGCISIVLKKELLALNIDAIDISPSAINVATNNAKENDVLINYIISDMYDYKPNKKYDILVSNPPYIKEDMEVSKNTKYEPQNAIFAADEGLVFYKYLLSKKEWLNDHYLLAFEIGYEQGDTLKEIAKNLYPDATISVEKDLANKDRYLFIYE